MRTENNESFLAVGDPEDEIGGHFHGLEIGEAIRQIEAAQHAGGDREGREPRRLQ